MVFFYYFGGIFEFIYLKMYHISYVNYAYFYILFLNFFFNNIKISF